MDYMDEQQSKRISVVTLTLRKTLTSKTKEEMRSMYLTTENLLVKFCTIEKLEKIEKRH